jgi:hypothetical protein
MMSDEPKKPSAVSFQRANQLLMTDGFLVTVLATAIRRN